MNISTVKYKLKRIGYFIPINIRCILLIMSLLLAANWLTKNNALPDTSRTAIINLFIAVTSWFSLSILLVSFLTAFIPWMFFLLNKKNNRASLKIKIAEKETILNENQQIEIDISKVENPLFGYIRLRLIYDGQNVSSKFAPVRLQSKKQFFSGQLKGLYNWPLHYIKEYDINRGIIYFEDFFQFFSFATIIPANSNFFTHPPKFGANQLIVQPKNTKETDTRIDEIKKVEGEFLNYKNFESNDDVRRIVWKIYAKNKELVVRIPETNDPYASHIYFYASFHNALSSDIYEEFNSLFLNYFKTVTWNSYEQLSRQNAMIQLIPDQQTKVFYSDDAIQKVKYFISTAHWQNQNNLLQYFNNRDASVLCISSFSDAGNLKEIIDKAGKELVIIFVQLTNSFEKIKINTWLQWLFIKPEERSTDKLKIVFTLSPLKREMMANEKKIKQLLDKSDCEILII